MIRFPRRLIFWLIKAYIKKWGKMILLYFAIGLFVFFVFRLALGALVAKIHFFKKETIGIVGAYSIDDLQPTILYKISRGLTSVAKDGTVMPDVALKWGISKDGKTYVFYLRHNIYFSDGTNLTSDLINYSFSDVTVTRPNKYIIVYSLKDSYSPFLITVSKPIFKKGFLGVSDYKVNDINLNGSFVEYINLVSKRGNNSLTYQFYPTEESLKTAFILGEVSKITKLSNVKFKNTTFYSFKNAMVEKKVDYKRLVTLFYNTADKMLSSKILREALTYTIPDNFMEGLRNVGPFSPFSFASQGGLDIYKQDLEHAKLLLEKASASGSKNKISLTIDTLPQYKNTGEKIALIWRGLGIEANVRVINKIPSSFQIFLGEFNLALDPDQYTLWHSNQSSNITHYNNLRVDKLLEDGRKEVDLEKRKKIYADFQKYILSDPPASFLFFPYTYDITRK